MTVAEKIIERIRHLPEPVQMEVLNYVEYLETKAVGEEHGAWSGFSLFQAMRDMESEPSSYSARDLKEVFA